MIFQKRKPRGQRRRPLKDKAGWYLHADERGTYATPQPVDSLPSAAVISADGKWAELEGNHGVEKVFVRLGGRA